MSETEFEPLHRCCASCAHWDRMEQEEASHIGLVVGWPSRMVSDELYEKMVTEHLDNTHRIALGIITTDTERR